MVNFVKVGKEDFKIIDWVTTKENSNDFIMKFRVGGNVQAARQMVNQRLKGIIGSYSIQHDDSDVCLPLPTAKGVSPDHTQINGAEDELERRVKKPAGEMPRSTSEL